MTSRQVRLGGRAAVTLRTIEAAILRPESGEVVDRHECQLEQRQQVALSHSIQRVAADLLLCHGLEAASLVVELLLESEEPLELSVRIRVHDQRGEEREREEAGLASSERSRC